MDRNGSLTSQSRATDNDSISCDWKAIKSVLCVTVYRCIIVVVKYTPGIWQKPSPRSTVTDSETCYFQTSVIGRTSIRIYGNFQVSVVASVKVFLALFTHIIEKEGT